ncbi:MAG: N-acetylmuramoyl-L-alanine amidase [Chlamydiia bacterium]|nr:N-acetylmuramoyl-L-alanine amidase [Chlamydiia bacterium]
MGFKWRAGYHFTRKAIGAFLFLVSTSCYGIDFEDFAPFQGKLSKEYVREKIAKFLQYSPEIQHYFSIEEEALALFASPEAKKEGVSEYRLAFGVEVPGSCIGFHKPLQEMKIAIDPGHFGGEWAQLEERYIDLEYQGKRCVFDEGTLTLLTALLLKEKLEKVGITVLLTRTEKGKGVYPENFFDWLKKHPELWKKGVSLSSLFRGHYNRLDLRQRAEMINAFKPDLTFVVHYNAVDDEKPKNFNLVFIPGAFCDKELEAAEDRYHFLRLICTQDLEQSSQLAEHLIGEFSKHLEVFPFNASLANSLKSGKGIYCRNLCLTRLIHGPVCYGETLVQNHQEELLKLSQADGVVEGMPCPQRVFEVAQAYYEALMTYLGGEPCNPSR